MKTLLLGIGLAILALVTLTWLAISALAYLGARLSPETHDDREGWHHPKS